MVAWIFLWIETQEIMMGERLQLYLTYPFWMEQERSDYLCKCISDTLYLTQFACTMHGGVCLKNTQFASCAPFAVAHFAQSHVACLPFFISSFFETHNINFTSNVTENHKSSEAHIARRKISECIWNGQSFWSLIAGMMVRVLHNSMNFFSMFWWLNFCWFGVNVCALVLCVGCAFVPGYF